MGIFLPSFFISFFLHRVVSSARKNQRLRVFLDGLSAASVSIIAVVGWHLLVETVSDWRGTLILASCLGLTLVFKKISSFYIILLGSVAGFLLLKL
ncbi:hypothetical protein A4H97_11615 [Niastella yeongjuensis]|uniref:Chromate transporter n=1 Tax=Niastella yeongjuensis TaxID=354355 RepID=A0A1V9E9N9_9BACT|nr:chromate transporter [Niastella yeongjuensis]OQP42801.1 hypothetical protein A4H97_11615 [Niastella yeongjuensis]SEO54645.1 Chromate transporter [Niastella yeongjuensis]